MVPGAVAYTYLGYAGREAAAGGEEAIRKALLALGLLATIAFLPRLVRRLRARDRFIDAGELSQRLGRTVVIDVRGPDEFAGPLGHIPEARNITLDELPAKLPPLSGLKTEPITLVCLTDKRSSEAASILREAGFRDVSVLRGGMKRWNEEGFPIEKQNRPSERSPRSRL